MLKTPRRGQKVADAEARGRCCERCHHRVGAEDGDGGVPPLRFHGRGGATDLEDAIFEIQDPVLVDAGARVGGGLASAGDTQSRLRDLNDQSRVHRVCARIVARRTAHDADIGLGLRTVVEDDRALRLDEPPVTERALQRLRRQEHRRPMRAMLRLLHEEMAVQQLDRIVLVEHTLVDQAAVLEAVHAAIVSAAPRRVNVPARRQRSGRPKLSLDDYTV